MNHKNYGIYLKTLFLLPTFCFIAAASYAAGSSGIEIGLDSARALGKGNAVVADPQDASTLVYNPAGLAKLHGNQLAINTTTIIPYTKYSGTNGISEDGADMPAFIPSFFVSLNTPWDPLKIAGGVNAPFGLHDQYSSTGNFKYTGISNSVKSIYYTLDAAYEVTPWLSVGGGASYVDAHVKQVSKLNSSYINAAFGDPTGYPDANTELDVTGHGYGWNMGVLLTPADNYSIGFFYRSSVKASLDGEYDVDNIQGPFVLVPTFGGNSFHTSADTTITLPDSAVIGLNYKASEKLNLEVDFGWTGWGKWDHFDINYGTTNAVLSLGNPSEHKFQDAYSINFGAEYKLNPNWNVLAGYAYFKQAALENDYSNVFPDGDRHSITVGLQYHINQVSLALAYGGQFVDGPKVDNEVGNLNNASVDGSYSGFYHLVLASVTYKFN